MLSSYSVQSLSFLLELLPDLRPFVQEKGEWFEINTVSPSGWEFWVSSANREMTVGFAEYHIHFGWHEGDPADDATDATGFIQDLRGGKLVIAMWFQGDEYVSSQPVNDVAEALPKNWIQRWWRRKQQLQVKKWLA